MLELELVSAGSVFSRDVEQLAAFLSLRDCSKEKAKAVKYLLRLVFHRFNNPYSFHCVP